MRIIFILSLFWSLSGFVLAQADGDKPFEIPSSYTTVMLVNDPSCPLQLQGPTRVIGWPYGGKRFIFTIQNVSKANVESFLIEEKDWFGRHGYSMRGEVPENIFFVPLMTIPSADDYDLDALTSFDAKRIAETIGPSLNKIWIAMVVKVKLSDGTTYDASKNYKKLERFLDTFDSPISANDLDLRERNLRELLSTFTVKK